MDKKYFGSFSDRRSMAQHFADGGWRSGWEVPADFPTEEQILFASYGGASYEGDAFVLFERDGKLYEVHGSHCSCYGLEGQWEPEETTWAALDLRPRNGYPSPMQDHDEDAARALWALVDSRKTADAVDPQVTSTGKLSARDGNSSVLPSSPTTTGDPK